jgi:Fis family transcriptional regulator
VARTTSKSRASNRKSSPKPKTELTSLRNRPLRDFAAEALRHYFRDLNGHKASELYGLVMSEVELPLFSAVMEHTQGNQSQAAEILGINRATLRKKLKQYELLG